MNKIESIVRKYIIHHNLFKSRGRYIVALSGGADSVALLLILQQLGVSVSAAHCNFISAVKRASAMNNSASIFAKDLV